MELAKDPGRGARTNGDVVQLATSPRSTESLCDVSWCEGRHGVPRSFPVGLRVGFAPCGGAFGQTT